MPHAPVANAPVITGVNASNAVANAPVITGVNGPPESAIPASEAAASGESQDQIASIRS